MKCSVCKKGSEDTEIFEGILEDKVIYVCVNCADDDQIPIIKKPSDNQLNIAEKNYSVRERMEEISGMKKTTEISDDQLLIQKNLTKLKIPEKKQYHEDILDDYYWTLNLARRRKKLSIEQLAEKMETSIETIQGIEKGKFPKNFEALFLRLETFLGIKLLKNHKSEINFTKSRNIEKEILDSVKEKMENLGDELDENEDKDSIEEINFSKRKELQDVTLNDLINMKKSHEKKRYNEKTKAQYETMVGGDVDLEIEED
tara:strand:- start:2164 stop:2937 length:774 start_codon:yes stop_codon:yes gene_type:complete